ncbi:MAG: ATP-dependent nuclease [Acidobacteriota bacterium]
MEIARVRVSGFRGVRTADIRFDKQSILVGPNGCGKSTLIDALSLALGRTKLVRSLTEHDFSGSEPLPATRLKIIVSIVGFSTEDPSDHDEWFRADRAVPKWLGEDGQEYAEAGTGRRLCVNIGFCARFDREELEVVSIRYFHDDDDVADPFQDESSLAHVPTRLLNEIGFFVLPARRDWDAVASFNSELFRRTVSSAAGIPAEEILEQRDALRNPAVKIEESERLSALVNGLNDRLARVSPAAPRFQLRVTTGESEAVLQALLPHYTSQGGPSLPAARHGAGLVALQSLLLLLEVGRGRKAKGLSFVMALEEPELHLAPGLHGRLVSEAGHIADQIICTTHSADVARVFPATSINIASNLGGVLATPPFLVRPLAADASNNERKLYVQNRARVVSALMHSSVLVPEGRFDMEWLTRFANIADPWTIQTSPLGAVVGVVPTENASVVFTTSRLVPLHPRVISFVDGDGPGDGYVQELLVLSPPPSKIIQLPPAWTIEDVVCWMIEPGAGSVLPALDLMMPNHTVDSLDSLRALLKTSNDKSAGIVGLKEDVLAHDSMGTLLEENPDCRARAVLFCEAIVGASTSTDHPRVVEDVVRSTPATKVFRFIA